MEADLRVTVSLVLRGLTAVLYCLLRTPLEAGKALLAPVAPRGLSVKAGHLHIAGRADLDAHGAAVAFLVDPEPFVPARDLGKGQLVNSGEKKPLPEGPFLQGAPAQALHQCGYSLYLGQGGLEKGLLFPPGSGPSPGYVVRGQSHGEA
jgi:hypothetical protein